MRPFLTASLLLAAATGAFANPLPASYVGTARGLQVLTSGANYFPNTIAVSNSGSGTSNLGAGGFTGQFQMSGPFNSANSYAQTTVWCVDSQLSFSPSTASRANVTLLNNSGWNSSQVRYGTLSGNSGGTYTTGQNSFVYDVGLTGVNDTAVNRFRMVSYLVSQYSSFPNGPMLGTATDDAIQRAIWKIMYNNTGSNSFNYSSADVSSGAAAGSWIDIARNFALNANNASYFNNWAVVSWTVDANGNFGNGYSGYQTFVVQVVPEPGFYGVLALGLSALGFAVARRKHA